MNSPVSRLLAVTRLTLNKIVRSSLPCDVEKLLRRTYATQPLSLALSPAPVLLGAVCCTICNGSDRKWHNSNIKIVQQSGTHHIFVLQIIYEQRTLLCGYLNHVAYCSNLFWNNLRNIATIFYYV